MTCARKCNDCCECLSAHEPGKTCADCVFVSKCVAIFGTTPADTACQWVPSRCMYADVMGDAARVQR